MKKSISMLAGVALAAAVGPAVAGFTLFEDDDLDFHLRPSIPGDPASPLVPVIQGTNIEQYDVLIAVLEFNTANGVPFAPDRELTGITVIQRTNAGGPSYVFEPYAGGFNAATGTNVGPDGAPGGGAMLAMWLDDTPDLAVSASLIPTPGGFSCSTLAQCMAQASDGGLFEVDGVKAGDNSYWDALALTTDPSAILAAQPASILGFFNTGLSVLVPGLSDADQNGLQNGNLGPIDVIMSGTINGGGYNLFANVAQRNSLVNDGYTATTDTDLQKTIPAPATLALLGAGLLGFRMVGRRRA